MSDLQLTESMYPPGWDVKYDSKTGKCYYINYLTKAMQLEDPRIRYRQLQNEHASTESIPMQTSSQTCFTDFQPLHGSPYHVYPINNHPPAVQAFQAPNTASLYNVSTSPLLTNKLQKMEMSPVMRMGSPNISRIIQHFDKTSLSGSGNYQETSFITQADTDAAVAKINTMFPTASDAHIRLLLKKYLKSIYPKAEEMLLLDILANADNNVQKASEKLTSMGYEKRDTTALKQPSRGREDQVQREKEKNEIEHTPPLQPRLKSNEEKQKIKNQLKARYKNVAGRIITMALDSVDYSEEKACRILEIVMQDDKNTKEELQQEVKGDACVDNETAPITISAGPAESAPDAVDHDERTTLSATPITSDSMSSESDNKYKSPWNNQKLSIGPNSTACNGPNEDLLLADYIAWNGANSELCKGSHGLAKGPDPTLRTSRIMQTQGSKSELCKGPNASLVKGSIYAQLKMQQIANVKCN